MSVRSAAMSTWAPPPVTACRYEWCAATRLVHEQLDEAVFEMGGGAPVRLNPRLYLIWKLQGYCTPYHQDVHVPPHFTLYNQTSGAQSSSLFLLPLLPV